MRKSTNRGFTLIELVIVLVIVGILAAIAIPRFQNLTTDAKVKGLQGILGNVRSALIIYKANALLTDPTVTGWPTLAQVRTTSSSSTLTATSPLENVMPANPYMTGAAATDTAAGNPTTRAEDHTTGWCYDVTTGTFYANTSQAVTINGVATTANLL
jgi:MSHA pilin protein MshA